MLTVLPPLLQHGKEYRSSGQQGVDTGEEFFMYDDSASEVARRRDDRLIAIEAALATTNDA